MELIQNLEDLRENLSTLEHYMSSRDASEKKFHRGLVKKGICFVTYWKGDRHLFAPSRFIGYKRNDMQSHINNKSKDGKETTPRINDIIHSQCVPDQKINDLYQKFCDELGFVAPKKGNFGVERKFWRI